MRKLSQSLLLILPLIAVDVEESFAAAIDLDGVNSGFSDGVDRVVGWQFTVGNEPVSVKQLGVFDFGLDGLTSEHQVGIWALDQSLLISGIVQNGTAATLDGNFRYVDVAVTQLQANTDYVIGATWPSSSDSLVWDLEGFGAPGVAVNSFTVDPRIALAGNGSGKFNDSSSSFAFPTKTIGVEVPGDRRRAFWGPNFAIVPEPKAIFLAVVGFAGLSVRRR